MKLKPACFSIFSPSLILITQRAPRAARTRSLNFLKQFNYSTHLFTEIATASNDIILMSGQWHSTKLWFFIRYSTTIILVRDMVIDYTIHHDFGLSLLIQITYRTILVDCLIVLC